MAIRLLQSAIVENYDVSPDQKFYQGQALIFDTSSPTNATGVSPVKKCNAIVTATTLGGFVGWSTTDHNTTGNTIIQNDPVGSTIISANGNTFTSYANGFYVGAARRIGEFQDETVAVVTNLTDVSPSGNATPLRGVGCVRQHGSQFVTDQFNANITGTLGNRLYVGSDALLTDTDPGSGYVLARVDYYDSTAGLLYATIIA